MKYRFFATGFVFMVCVVVFVFINARPVSMNLRFKGTAFLQDTQTGTDITITLEGNQHNKLFSKNSFTGYITVDYETFSDKTDAITLKFNKKGKARCKLTANNKELGTLTADKKFEHIVIELKDGTVIAAPATDISQAKEILKKL